MWPSNAGSGPKTGKFTATWAKKRQFSALTAKFGLKITFPQQLDTCAYSPAQGGAALHTMERPTMSYRTWKEKENAGTRILVKGMLCDVAQR